VGEVIESGGATVAFVSAGVPPRAEAGADDCGPGGKRDDCGELCGRGGAVSAEGGDVGLMSDIGLIHFADIHLGFTKTGRVKFLVLDEVLSSLDDERSEGLKNDNFEIVVDFAMLPLAQLPRNPVLDR
jgi:hypothetical protein